ncbi:ribosomal protein S6 kinase-like 1 [Chironomus tepperi]|uniref:ribosomal protein S6 kinase-like 1 n=1 Tax=Chironomus tepperi TaxID=113505 RepID=UPI00391F1A92
MATLGGLVHVFNILETQRLKKYTAYKIQMISFPKNESLFQSLTKLTIIKRYSDFKTLENNLLTTYKGYNFKTFFKSDKNYFNRFDPEIVEQRKRTILEYLYYCAEHSVLYRSQYFVKFFVDTSTKCDVEKIYDSSTYTEESPEESINSLEDDSETIEEGVETNELIEIGGDIDYYLCGYLYDAALNFSHAVQEEANLRYKRSFELYKLGIDKLLTGAKNDTNEARKRIAKTKASKYLEKAEQLYENYILEEQENEFLIEDIDTKETQSIASLERPLNHMSRYKVIQINKRIMKVQDRTDKKIYILKVIWKTNSHKVIFMPQNIPFMCSLLSYFHSENAIFILLPFISGGLLWDYVNSYSSSSNSQKNVEELFVDPPKQNNDTISSEIENIPNLAQLDVDVNETDMKPIESECSDNNQLNLNDDVDECDFITPSFDTLTPDIDVDDLMKCSQQLLKSVRKTLEKSVVIKTEEDSDENPQNHESEAATSLNDDKPVNDDVISNGAACVDEEKVEAFDSIPEFILKRWASEIIISVSSLHKNGIIIGDLNLDNILLGSNGHILLTYFHQNYRSNLQQLCELNQKALKCYYVAFEFPLTRNSDYYSIGVILYEIFTRHRFYTYHPGGISKYNEIQYADTCQLSEQAKDLLDILIFKKFDQDAPLESIKVHPFFEGIDFNVIESFGYE